MTEVDEGLIRLVEFAMQSIRAAYNDATLSPAFPYYLLGRFAAAERTAMNQGREEEFPPAAYDLIQRLISKNMLNRYRIAAGWQPGSLKRPPDARVHLEPGRSVIDPDILERAISSLCPLWPFC